MQLSTMDGISCDMCGMHYKLDFVYYSFDFKKLPQSTNLPPLNHIIRLDNILSVDVCSLCFNDIRNRIITNYNPRKHMKYCEYSGGDLTEPYYCVITMVTVMNNKRSMRSSADPRHLEFILSKSTFDIFKNKQQIPNKSQWTTNS